MKHLLKLLPVVMLFLATTVYAQEQPSKEFTISLSENALNLKPGESQTIDVMLNRSKRFTKVKIDLFIGGKLPEGLNVEFNVPEGYPTTAQMVITADAGVTNLSKTITVKGKGSRVTKGTMLKLNVGETLLSDRP